MPEADLKKLQAVLDRFGVTVAEVNDLVVLQDYQIAVIADDSASMNKESDPDGLRQKGQPKRTRWHELQETIAEIVDVASCFDAEGINVFFLNRTSVLAVKDSKQKSFTDAFGRGAAGGTPLTEALDKSVAKLSSEKKTLLFILTDGEPDGGSDKFVEQVAQVVADGKVRIQIMACTPDAEEIGWLNLLDRRFPEVDVTDDYVSEKYEVIRAGISPTFARADWVMKAMLGPVSPKFDAWDEQLGKNTKGCPAPQCMGCSVM